MRRRLGGYLAARGDAEHFEHEIVREEDEIRRIPEAEAKEVSVVGGIIPLSAYLLLPDARVALRLSVVVTLVALGVFGGIKGKFTGVPVLRSALQTSVIGGLAAAAAFGIARLIS